jgi:uncharacterized protein with HEPN domain
MSDRERELFLLDIIVAIEKIRKVASKFDNGEDLKYDFLHWDSIIREFEIVGEAMKYCIQFKLFDDEREKRKVVDFRNILAHKYFGIDADAVLNIAKNNLDWLENLVINRFLQVEKTKREEVLRFLIEENEYLPFVKEKLEKIKNESK